MIDNNNRKVNYTIPLYFDESLSYLEMVGNLASQMQDVQESTDNLLQAIDYKDGTVDVKGNLVVDGTITGDIDMSGGTITANLDGNAKTASALKDSRNINITGDAEGSATFNGSEDANINLDVKNADSASKADKWSTARNIQLVGDVTGIAKVDGSQNVSIQTTIQGVTPTSITTIPNDLTIQGDLTIHKVDTTGETVEKNLIITAGDINLTDGYNLNGNVIGNVTGTVTGALKGLADSATLLNQPDAGSETYPIYFKDGIPRTCEGPLNIGITGNAGTATTAGSITGLTVDVADLNTLPTQVSNLEAKATIYSGTAEPTADIGVDGDIYIKYTA